MWIRVQHALGELLSCPICTGTWVAAGLVYGLHLAPRPTRVLLAIMSTTGVAHLLYSLTEALSWIGHAARRQAAGPSGPIEHEPLHSPQSSA